MNETLADLRAASLDELEWLYRERRPLRTPDGSFGGTFLCRLPTPSAQRLVWRAIVRVGFDLLPYGVDFDSQRWFFVHPRLRVGHFTLVAGPSRWRDTEALQLRYGVSRLPAPIRGILYDEVKPLSDGLLLGIGGSNHEKGEGEKFFFALERMR